MVTPFPSPILAVTPDAVRELQGDEALSGLWTLFTKCKESLQDGRRLENISWRLWYREMAATALVSRLNNDGKQHLNEMVSIVDRLYGEKETLLETEYEDGTTIENKLRTTSNSYRPPSPTSQLASTSPLQLQLPVAARSLSHADAVLLPLPGSAASSLTLQPHISTRRNSFVGKIIVDMLPNPLPPTLHRHPNHADPPSGSTLTSYQSNLYPEAYSLNAESSPHSRPTKCHLPISAPSTDPTRSSLTSATALPTPADEQDEQAAGVGTGIKRPLSVQVHVEVIEPHPSTPPPPPRVVVVNPTPGPTPQPTPPTTPVLGGNGGAGKSAREEGAEGGQGKRKNGGSDTLLPLLMPPPLFGGSTTSQSQLSPLSTSSSSSSESGSGSGSSSGQTAVSSSPSSNISASLTSSKSALSATSALPLPSGSMTLASSPGAQSVRSDDDGASMAQTGANDPPISLSPSLKCTTAAGAEIGTGQVQRQSSMSSDGGARLSPTSSAHLSPPTSVLLSPTSAPLHHEALTSAPASGSGPSRSRPSGHIRRTSSVSSGRSTSAGATKGSTSRAGNKGVSKALSASRSRDAGIGAGLVMTTSTKKSIGVGIGSGNKGRVLGAIRRVGSNRTASSSRRGSEGAGKEKTKDEVKSILNVGSNSDGGNATGSKSIGSGSSVSGAGKRERRTKDRGKGVTRKEDQRQQQLVLPRHVVALPPAPFTLPLPPQVPLPHPSTVIPPPQRRTTILIATSESEYETDTDDDSDVEGRNAGDDGGEWSSEEVSDDVVVHRPGTGIVDGKTQPQGALHSGHHKTQTATKGKPQPQIQPQPQQPQPPPQPQPTLPQPKIPSQTNVARSKSKLQHQPSHHSTHSHARAQSQQHRHAAQAQAQAARAQLVVEQAALEAQRQRDMFAKKPVSSAANLQDQNSESGPGQRTRSVGLLTQLMNPHPGMFPPNHPYRRRFSAEAIKGWKEVVAGTVIKVNEDGTVGPGPTVVKGMSGEGQTSAQGPQSRRGSQGKARPPPVRPGMQTSKSSAAVPVSSQVQVGSVAAGGEIGMGAMGAMGGRIGGHILSNASGGYRPKGRPAGQEMEDDSDGSDEDGIQVSKSVAQEKLKALAERRGITMHDNRADRLEEEPVPAWVREPQVFFSRPNGPHLAIDTSASSSQHPIPPPNQPMVAPIPLGHPYNLPPPAPPSTPRTTRQEMLRTEMSESLRRNLLWERRVSKLSVGGFKRSTSGGGGRGGGNMLGGGPPRPMAIVPSLVQLTAKTGTGEERERERERRGSAIVEGQEKEERQRRVIARNRSWGDDYHYSGW